MRTKFVLFLMLVSGILYSQNYDPILNYAFNGTPTNGIKIKTNLPFANGSQMPTLHIEGYNYGQALTINLTIVYYIYYGQFINYSISAAGGFNPEVKLANENGKVVIFINAKDYFNRFTIRGYAKDMMETPSWFSGWTTTDEPLTGTHVVTLPYKNSFWSATGNSGTNPANNFIGTTDSQNLIFKTNNTERLKIDANGNIKFSLNHLPTNDGMDIVDSTQNMVDGTDVVWIKSVHPQKNDVGVLSLSTSNWLYPIFSARENGKIFMGTNAYNYKVANCPDCASYRLFVKDGIRTEKVKVDIASANGWADYVFKEDYKLPTLESVEQHIAEKGHLSNIPSSEEVLKNGINLGEMDAKLLEKIEELTLYMIEQNKINKNQQEVINSLKKRIDILEKK